MKRRSTITTLLGQSTIRSELIINIGTTPTDQTKSNTRHSFRYRPTPQAFDSEPWQSAQYSAQASCTACTALSGLPSKLKGWAGDRYCCCCRQRCCCYCRHHQQHATTATATTTSTSRRARPPRDLPILQLLLPVSRIRPANNAFPAFFSFGISRYLYDTALYSLLAAVKFSLRVIKFLLSK